MLHAPPDLDRLRTLTDNALHGHTALGVDHPPEPFVEVAAAHLDVLLRSVDPDLVPDATRAHNRDMNRADQHARTIDGIAAAVDTLATAVTRDDRTTIEAAARNLTRLVRSLKETHRR